MLTSPGEEALPCSPSLPPPFPLPRTMSSVGGGLCVLIIKESAYRHMPYCSIRPGMIDEFCSQLNRAGTLCGSKCLYPLHGLLIQHDLCPLPSPPLELAVVHHGCAYLPLILFYFIILFFKVNTMSGHMHAAVFFCQALPILP